MNKDLTQLTLGERLWIDRHRRGETQAQAARRYGCARTTYLAAERDDRTQPHALTWGKDGHPRMLGDTLPTVATLPERLRLARRRLGGSMGSVALDLGVSRATLLTWEKAGRMELVLWWEKWGWSVAVKDAVSFVNLTSVG